MDHQPAGFGISDQQDPIPSPQPTLAPDHGGQNQETLATDAEDPTGFGRHNDEAMMLTHISSRQARTADGGESAWVLPRVISWSIA
jgi:hypothetical protein